ncbi:SpoIID/LytB domain-containing protein [Bacillus coreaensis]
MINKLVKILLLFTIIFSLFPITKTSAAEPTLQVKLRNYLGNKTEVTVSIRGNYLLGNSNTVMSDGTSLKLKLENGQIAMYSGAQFIGRFDSISLSPLHSTNILTINQKPYSGSFIFTIESTSYARYIRPINTITIEEYLRGVVPNEMPASWSLDALKAQSVAARTYALSYLGGVIDDTINYQVYGGLNTHPYSDAAIKATAGQVLKYNGRLINAVFSASNGGMTESNANVWGSTPVPYFIVKEDSFDPKTAWTITVNKEQINVTNKNLINEQEWWNTTTEANPVIASNIKAWLYNNGYYNKEIKIVSVNNLSLSQPSSGGRVTKGSIVIKFFVRDIRDANNQLVLQKLDLSNTTAVRIRALLGNRQMLSYLVDEVVTTETLTTIKGRGDGHGVGLSQWGAKKRADNGQSYKDILTFYYPGTNLVTEYSSKVQRLSGSDRYATNRQILQQLPDHSLDHIILVSGENYPDALAGGALAKPLNTAVVLINNQSSTLTNSLPEIRRLLMETNGKIYIVGGTSAISTGTEEYYRKNGFTVERIAGKNRVDTSIEVAKLGYPDANEAFLVYGHNFPDALSVVPAANKMNMPILLNSSKTELSPELLNYIKTHGIEKITLVGGSSAIPEAVVHTLEENQVMVTRISGSDRTQTSLEVAKTYFPGSTKVSIANGFSFPDALSAGPFAYFEDMPVILIPSNDVPASVLTTVNDKEKIVLFGGKSAISDTVEGKIK